MSWEDRRGRRYYTRSRRAGGRIVRQYIGRGRAAEAIAWHDAREREQRAARAADRRAAWARERAASAALEALAGEVDGAIAAVAEAGLVLAGYHRHHRGAWRRRRGRGDD